MCKCFFSLCLSVFLLKCIASKILPSCKVLWYSEGYDLDLNRNRNILIKKKNPFVEEVLKRE